MTKKAAKKPTKFFLFLKSNPDDDSICEYIINENLIQMVTFNGVNDVKIMIKGEPSLFRFSGSSQKQKEGYLKLKQLLSPDKIN